MNEDFIYEAIALIATLLFLLPFLASELINRRNTLDEFTRKKLMKIGRYAYDVFEKEDKLTAKQRTAQFMREVYQNGELNKKYDLIKFTKGA